MLTLHSCGGGGELGISEGLNLDNPNDTPDNGIADPGGGRWSEEQPQHGGVTLSGIAQLALLKGVSQGILSG